MNYHKKNRAGVFILLLCFFSCKKHEPEPVVPIVPVENFEPIAGAATTFDNSVSAYQHVIGSVNAQTNAVHQSGSVIFLTDFTESGNADFDGLGPQFIQSSCVGCHPGNGRSQPPLSEIDYDSGLLMRFSLAGAGPNGEPVPVPGYGTQLQTRGIGSNIPEANFIFNYSNNVVTYDDGSEIILHNPSHSIINAYTSLPPNVLFTMRNASPIYGLGLLEAISETEILVYEDETDDNGDYISGKANYVWNVKSQQMELGRFGWKASVSTIEQQVAGAFHEDMGITVEGFFPVENCDGQSNCTGASVEPDLSESRLEQVAMFIRTLAVPNWRNQNDSIVLRGKQIFHDLNCNGCHRNDWTTSVSTVPELNGIEIHPFTDLLLHDMGEVLADGRPDFEASTNEWRTAPLWGIGLTKLVNPDARFLHDGRAATLEEAILWHGGEAHWIINYFKALPLEDRNALIAFLESL